MISIACSTCKCEAVFTGIVLGFYAFYCKWCGNSTHVEMPRK